MLLVLLEGGFNQFNKLTLHPKPDIKRSLSPVPIHQLARVWHRHQVLMPFRSLDAPALGR